MPRRARGLSAALVAKAKPGRYGDGAGLYLLVRPNGRWYCVRYRHAGRAREVGLGPAAGPGAITLAEAREAARPIWQAHRQGLDPLAQRRAEKMAQRAQGVSFRDEAERYIASHSAGWRSERHGDQWRVSLDKYVYPILGDLPVASIETAHVLQVVQPLWATKSETASRLRGRIEMVLDAAAARGLRTGANPARWKGGLAHLLPARGKVSRPVHLPALPYDDLPEFMSLLRERAGSGAQALQFAILTAARTGEVLSATWQEIDMDAALWTIPAARMKSHRLHRVPLSPAALGILRAAWAQREEITGGAPGPADPVFRTVLSDAQMGPMAMIVVLRRMARTDVTVHGFRSTFRDWCAERTNYPSEAIEMALAHAVGNKVEAAYRRGDLLERRQRLMRDWAAFCLSGEDASASKGKVVALR